MTLAHQERDMEQLHPRPHVTHLYCTCLPSAWHYHRWLSPGAGVPPPACTMGLQCIFAHMCRCPGQCRFQDHFNVLLARRLTRGAPPQLEGPHLFCCVHLPRSWLSQGADNACFQHARLGTRQGETDAAVTELRSQLAAAAQRASDAGAGVAGCALRPGPGLSVLPT